MRLQLGVKKLLVVKLPPSQIFWVEDEPPLGGQGNCPTEGGRGQVTTKIFGW